jgi:predicted O-methyltransferase YrrM
MNKYEFTIPDWFRSEQFSSKIPNISPNSILEIGSFEGRSTVWFIERFLNNKTKSITCIDPWLNYNHDETSLYSYGESARDRNHNNNEIKNRFHKNIESTGKSSQVKVIQGLSHNELPKLYVNGDRFDLIFIDGNHTGSFVLTDAVMSWWLLNEGGVIIFDDYLWSYEKKNPQSTPKFAIDSFIACFKGYLDVIHMGQYAIIQKKKSNV